MSSANLPLIVAFSLLVITVPVFVGLSATFGRWWRHDEMARKALGVATVLVLAAIGIPFGLIPWYSWLFVFGLFGMAGGTNYVTTVHKRQVQEAAKAENLARQLRAQNENA